MIKAIGFTLGLFLFWGSAHAAIVIDKGTTETYFKVEGKRVTAEGANAAANAGRDVEQCKPKKGNFETKDGSDAGAIYVCKFVDLVVSSKTGASHWKAK